MMNIEYWLADPTGNMTLLVTSPCCEERQTQIASELMCLEPTAEQLGFLTEGADEADIVLRMSGGEFCGNAAMSAGAFVCMTRGLTALECTVKVCGTEKPVRVSVDGSRDGWYSCRVTMPRPTGIRKQRLMLDGEEREFTAVCFSGITHIICQGELTRSQAENNIREWCTQLGCEALGIMLLNLEEHRIDPLVYVAGIDSLFWESSCASGTTAVGVYLSAFGEVNESFTEPGGVLSIRAVGNENPVLGGKVRFGEKNTAVLEG